MNGSRRVASRSATVCRVIRPCADRKTRYRTAAAAIAAVTVTRTTSRRAASMAATIGAASRQTPTTPTTVPSWSSGRYSRSVRVRAEVARARLALRRRGRARRPAGPQRRSPVGGVRGGEARQRHVAGEDRAVRAPDLGADDPAGRDEGLQPGLERGLALGRDRRRGEVGRPQQVVDEAADDLGVGADGLVERRRRDVDGREHDLRRRGHADDHEEYAVHEEQQDRAGRAANRAGRRSLGSDRRARDCACRPGVGRHLAPRVRVAMPWAENVLGHVPGRDHPKVLPERGRTAGAVRRGSRTGRARLGSARSQAALNPPRSDRREPVS